MIDMDSYAHRSGLRHQDAVQKIFFACFMMAICFWAKLMVISALVFALMSSFTVLKGKIPCGVYIKALMIPVGFFLVGALSLMVDKAGAREPFLLSIPFGSGYIGVVNGGWLLVLPLLARAIALVSCLYYLSFNTPMIDLLNGLGRLKVPPLIIELLGLIYRFIFIILAEVNVIFIAQRSRLGYVSFGARFRSLGALAASVFVRSYRRFDHLYTALESRGYAGTLNVLEEPRPAAPSGYLVPLAWGGLFILLTIGLRAIF